MKRILAPLAASVAMWLSPPVAAQSLGDVLEASILTGWHREDGKHVAALHIDLDRFKQINDTMGHAAGDHVLVIVSERLRHILREQDVITRTGGDEFVVMLTDVKQKDDVALVAGRAVHALAAPIETDGMTVSVGASIGVASYPENADDGEALLRLADQAMYDVKRSGKNGFRIAA